MEASLSQSQLITVDNQTSGLGAKELFNLAWAVNYQLLFHYGRSRWVTGGFAPHAHAMLLPKGMKPPVGAWNLILLDHSDQQGALGYHDDEKGTKIPFSEVFCVDAQQDGSTPTSVASHEAIEMVVDPDVEHVRTVERPGLKQLYIVEACDAVQGNDYDIGEPEGRTTGTKVADFCLPAWWMMDEPKGAGPVSFRQSVTEPFQLAPQGYISVAPVEQPNSWSQIWGGHAERLPRWASRLPRIHPELRG